jgi:hypothetical protein
LYWNDKSKEPTKEGPLSFVLFESPFTTVSTVSRVHPSLISVDYRTEGKRTARVSIAISYILLKRKEIFFAPNSTQI